MLRKMFNMGQMSDQERKEVAEAYDSEDLEGKRLVHSLAFMPYSPRDLERLSTHISPYLHIVGKRLITIDDVWEGSFYQLLLVPEGAGLNERGKPGLLEFDYERLTAILETWERDLANADIGVVSSEEALQFVDDVEARVGVS